MNDDANLQPDSGKAPDAGECGNVSSTPVVYSPPVASGFPGKTPDAGERGNASSTPVVHAPPVASGFHGRALRRAWRLFHEGSLAHWTTATIIAISLTIFGTLTLLLTNADTLLSRWQGDNLVTVFTRSGVTAAPVSHMHDRLAGNTLVDPVTLRIITPDVAIARLKKMLDTEAGLLDQLEDNPLPFTLEFKLKHNNFQHTSQVAQEILTWPGVESVSYDRQWADRMAAVIRTVRYLGNILSLLLLSAVALIVSNTIKLTIIARREEIEVMRFMGATGGFIKAPFIYEGVLQGILGAIAAIGLTGLLHLGAERVVKDLGASFGFHLDFHFLPLPHLALILAIGMGLGLIGALLSLSRFLKV
ncbi:MAG: ABC transporter permease [Magnetococcales bacterium]|nr:ABC transporter permease [Magnetococcales bacterium]